MVWKNRLFNSTGKKISTLQWEGERKIGVMK